MNTRWSYSSIAVVLWVGVALILPAARAVGLVHLSWWICAAPFGIFFLLGSITIIFAGLLGHAAFQEELQQRLSDGGQRDVASVSQNDGASPPHVPQPAFFAARFTAKK